MTKTRVVHVNDRVPGAIYIGRAMPRQRLKASPFANPYKIGATLPTFEGEGERIATRADVIALYADDLDRRLASAERQSILDQLHELRGRPLACWCRHDGETPTPENTCHGDVLIQVLRELGWDTPPHSKDTTHD